MTSSRRGGLGRGLGALIPTAPRLELAPSPPRDGPDQADQRFEPGSFPSPQPTDATVSGVPRAAEPADRDVESTVPEPADRLGLVPVPGAEFREILIEQVRPNPRQPRVVFDDEALEELAHSVREFGVLQPVIVRPVDGGYELVMGERRLRAAAAAGLVTLPAIVRDTADDVMLRDALLENIHRTQLNPLEEAAAYQQLLEEFGVTHDELASRIGRSRSQVSNTVRLMNLSLPVQRRVAAGVLSAGHARALLALPDAEAQDDLASRIVAEGLSVRATEELVSLITRGLGTGSPRRRRPVRRDTAPVAAELAEKLSDTFDTRVRVDIGQRKGKITIEFASVEDLDRIISVMAPHLAAGRSAAPDPDRDLSAADSDAAYDIGATGSNSDSNGGADSPNAP